MKKYLSLFLIMVLIGCKPSGHKENESHVQISVIDTLATPAGEGSSLPRLFQGGPNLYLSWVSKKDTLNYLQLDKFDGVEWLHTDTIISGSDWFVNWADFPQIAENNDYLLSSYLKKSASGTYTYDVRLNHFAPSSIDWKKDYLLNTDGTQSEHGFVSIQPIGDYDFFVSWLDGRNTIGIHDHEHMTEGAMTLRGAFVDSTGTIYDERELDPRVCDCCNTASTVTSNALVVAYRNRTEEEIRDIAVVRYNGHTWEEPKIVGNDDWKIPGCPVNGPALDSFKESLAMAWFTAANDIPKVQVAFSIDEGATFGMPFRIDSGNAIGRVDIVMLNETEAAVSWMEPEGEEAVIQVRRISIDGTMSMPLTISKTSIERASGFPQMELFYSRLYFAWTETKLEDSQIKMASVSLESL